MPTECVGELSQDVLDRLRKIAVLAGNESAVDKDPMEFLSMLLYAVDTHASLPSGGFLRFIIEKYCSSFGMETYARFLKEKKIA